jgi:3-oxoacyl-[acyl-carrier protein] reductase
MPDPAPLPSPAGSRPDEGRLSGRAAVVTGAARGIGRAIVERLAVEGAAVAFSYRGHAEEAAELAERLARAGRSVVAVRADVSVAADCDRLVATAVDRYGRLDILVNNAAETDTHRDWTAISEADWDHVMAVNARGGFLCFRAAYPYLRQSPAGRVVNIGSVTFEIGQARLLHYVASKGAVVGFTRSLAREIGPDGITVNAVEPGAIQTEAEAELFPGQAAATAVTMAGRQSIGRRGLPSDVAGAVAFFASDDAAFITGQTLLVDGGWAMR